MARSRVVKRGAVVDIISSRDGAKQARGIVMGMAPMDNYGRAYGREYVVCEVYPDAKSNEREATAALKRGDRTLAKRLISEVTTVHETNRLRPLGQVKKIPRICRLAVKLEKGKL